MEFLIYLGKVSLYWTLFYICYWLFLRKQTFFKLNRLYLLGTLLLAFALPFLHLSDSTRVMPTAVYAVSAIPVYVSNSETLKLAAHWINFIRVVQVIGAFLMLFKLVERLRNLFSLIRQGESIEMDEYTLVLLPHNEIGSFSFFRWLVINQTDYAQHPDTILRHESVHIRQLHSLDILFLEILKVFFWFHPVLWFYKNSLQEVHEYLADEEAPNRDQYARFLVSYALAAPGASLTNRFFNSSLLKSRIRMIYKNRNSHWSLGKYLLIFPMIGTVLMLTAARERLLSAVALKNYSFVSNLPIQTDENNIGLKVGIVDDITQSIPTTKNGDARTKSIPRNYKPVETQPPFSGNIADTYAVQSINSGQDKGIIRIASTIPDLQPGSKAEETSIVRYTSRIHVLTSADAEKTQDSFNRFSVRTYPSESSEVKEIRSGETIETGAENLNSYHNPLIIMDGKIIGNIRLNNIKTENIESVDVIKGANATSVYGLKAINGAISIKSKK